MLYLTTNLIMVFRLGISVVHGEFDKKFMINKLLFTRAISK